MLIFHSPRPIDSAGRASGSTLRPAKMLEAFRSLGADVFLVDGASGERAAKWAEVPRFGSSLLGVYSELSTMPMALADPDHMPRAPFHDFRQFTRLRRSGFPVAAFYRDVYWRFEHYSRSVPIHKRLPALAFYWQEVWQLARHVDHVFLPSMRMKDYVPFIRAKEGVSALPPGGAIREVERRPQSAPLRLFYVGGVGGEQYDLSPMVRAVEAVDGVKLTLCCRETEWNAVRGNYGGLRNVDVVHQSGQQLDELYRTADIFLMWRRMVDYLRFSMPVKLPEAVGWGLPVITNAECEMGDVVMRDRLGWSPATEEELAALLVRLRDDRSQVAAMRDSVLEARERHSWRARARDALSVLERYRKAYK